MLYVYAISRSSPPAGSRGLGDAVLRAVGDAPPFAVVSDHSAMPIEGTEEDLWAHERVVEALMDAGAILPMRLGSTAVHDAALLAVLRRRRGEFQSALERVAGAVELGVRVKLPAAQERPAARPEGGPGTAYLLGRAARERQAAGVVERVHTPLASLARRSVRRAVEPRGRGFSAAYLVDRPAVSAFKEHVDRITGELEGVAIACTGPWPPYSFSSGREA
jgi:hypothetical protein